MNKSFNGKECLEHISHYLPSQAPLKDFVHHNTLHAFQQHNFFEALQTSNEIFGYKSSLSLQEYQNLFAANKISQTMVDWVVTIVDSDIPLEERKNLMLQLTDQQVGEKRIGNLRAQWKNHLKLDLDTIVHLNLFKIVGSYLDQGISGKPFPNNKKGLLNAIIDIEKNTFFEFFHSVRVKELLFKKNHNIEELLHIVVGNEQYFEQYLFDQQFTHPGWSGIVCVIEKNPKSLLDQKQISFHDFVYLELLLEIDAMDKLYGEGKWEPITSYVHNPPIDMFQLVTYSKEWEVKKWWQLAFEFNYFDQVLLGLSTSKKSEKNLSPSFQAVFCIDDREESIRRNLELVDQSCQTFGSPAHFNLPIFYRPAGGKFNTQVCPGPINPQHIIMDDRNSERKKKEFHFHQQTHAWHFGWLISQTMGFWSAFKLFVNLFKPTVSPGHSSSFEHMSHRSNLIIDNVDGKQFDGLKVGFSSDEMNQIVFSELTRIGLTSTFAPIIYFLGHGGSSTNNPYYAGYNCGACSGRPSSLNARVFSAMANRPEVRKYLATQGVSIPETTQFLGGLHDTTRDEIVFYDESTLSSSNTKRHQENLEILNTALRNNAKERSRQFISVNTKKSSDKVHNEVKKRSVALFEPRPELNHSNNCLCIVGNRDLTKKIFLDQRSFLNSYDWKSDKIGESLSTILNAVTPVCGGINLEYYFSRVDNLNFGAGSKLPHNVVGLFGLANGIEGDLRTGLPIQMVEIHDPLRLMMVVEQTPEFVLEVLNKNPNSFQWYKNEWINLSVVHPETKESFIFWKGHFVPYTPQTKKLEVVSNLVPIFENSIENLPVFELN